ncbi:MAG: hypothetical protein ABEI80_04885 [Haloplanus sp.]
MAPKRSIATRTAARTSSVEDSGIFTALATFKRFGTTNADGNAGRPRALHHRSADGHGR